MAEPKISQRPRLPRRLAALVYDTFLVLPLVMAGVAGFLGVRLLLLGDSGTGLDTATLDPRLVQLIAGVIVITFFTLFWRRSGQTLGMQAWRIQLVSLKGGTVTSAQAVRRCLGAALSALCLGIGYLWCLIDPNGRYWHDYLSGTELILVPKPDKKKR